VQGGNLPCSDRSCGTFAPFLWADPALVRLAKVTLPFPSPTIPYDDRRQVLLGYLDYSAPSQQTG
jgi:hypothetical protein